MSLVARQIVIEGRVQGVGFRWHLRGEARALGVDGWVRNLPGGEVEAWFEGPARAVEALEAWATRGPSGARVEGLTARDVTPEFRRGFEVRR